MKNLVFILLTVLPTFCIGKVRAIFLATTRVTTIGAVNGEDNKKNRTSMLLQVPGNAIKIIYQISTYSGEHAKVQTQPLSLLAQINQHLNNGGMKNLNNNITSIQPSSTTALIDVYLFGDEQNNQLFSLGQSGSYMPEYSRYNFTGGAVAISLDQTMKHKNLWLGVKNLSEASGITVVIEAVALIDDNS